MATYTAKKHRGFTIIELIVVVTVIAVLAAITIVSYNRVQSNARDTLRKNDVATLGKLIGIYASQTGTWAPAGCGDTANYPAGLTGNINQIYTSSSIMTCLKNFDSTTKQISDPSGCVSATDAAAACKSAYRGYYGAFNCGSSYYVMAKLETPAASGPTTVAESGICTSPAGNTFATSNGYNYLLKIR